MKRHINDFFLLVSFSFFPFFPFCLYKVFLYFRYKRTNSLFIVMMGNGKRGTEALQKD